MLSLARRVWRMRPVLVVSGAVVATGCAAITGLDQYEKGSDDAAVDASFSDQALPDSRGSPDSPGADTSALDSSADAGLDAPPDGADAGCALNTVDNCSACGDKCDSLNADDASCTSGTSCQYVCKTGFSNCDASAPDLGGCECATPSCCGASCATTHANGEGQSFYDCVALATYDQTQAGKACTAYTGNAFACNAAMCVGDGGDKVECGSNDAGDCACWDYVGSNVSHVYKSGSGTCFCPGTTDPTWN